MSQAQGGFWQGLVNAMNDMRHGWERLAYGQEVTDDAQAVNNEPITAALRNELHVAPERQNFESFYIGQGYAPEAVEGREQTPEQAQEPEIAPEPPAPELDR